MLPKMLFPLFPSRRRDTINDHLPSLNLEQRLAFGSWYSEALSPSDIAGGHRSLITDTGNLIAYLPFHIFQHLTPAQVLDLQAPTPDWRQSAACQKPNHLGFVLT